MIEDSIFKFAIKNFIQNGFEINDFTIICYRMISKDPDCLSFKYMFIFLLLELDENKFTILGVIVNKLKITIVYL